MNKILSILAVWLCSVTVFAQLNGGDDWTLPGHPGLVTKKITVAVNSTDFGTASATTATTYGAGVYPVGSTVALSATPATGYHFVNWTIGENAVSTNASYGYVMPDEDVTVTANFEPNKYKVAFVSEGKTVKTGYLAYKSEIELPADPIKEGYAFRGWNPAVDATVPANDVTYTAVFDINKYNVVFTVDGEEYSKASLEYGSEISVPDAPTKTGYTFGGWTTDATVPAHDVTYDATFNVNSYNVIFNADNGTENTVFTLEYGSAITAPDAPEKEGYTFAGWTPSVDGATVPANDITFTANWQVNSYKLSFVVDGVASESNVDFGSAITLPAAPTKDGYVFDGWTPAVALTMPAEDVTYTATWKLAKYLVTFISDGVAISTATLEYGSEIVPPTDPKKKGYNFIGWNPAVDATVPAHDVTYTASFGKGAFLVTFMVDDKVYSTTSMDFGELIVLPEDPTKVGYTFAGWDNYTDGATVPADNVTYTAKWNVNKYTVAFVSEGETVKSDELDYGSAITLPANPEKEGYSFDSWTPVVAETVPANDVTYTATFKINKYNVTFDVDGKVFSTATLEYGSVITAPESIPTKEGYTFKSWKDYADGATVPANDITYVAEWTPNKYVVTFVSEGNIIQSESLDFGSAIVVPDAPEKEGYSFDGWTPAVAETVPANDVTYTASFKINQYVVTFKSDDDVVKSETLDYGTTITVPVAPTKEGYTFTGWEGYMEGATVPAEDVTYTATWSINSYKVVFIDDDTVKSEILEYGAPIIAPELSDKEGYGFVGWFSKDGEDFKEGFTVPTHDITFYSEWTLKYVSLKFIVDGEIYSDRGVPYGWPIVDWLPDEPKKTGYTFTGWVTETGEEIGDKCLKEDMILTATWKINKYAVTFVVGSDTIKSDSLEYGAPIVVPTVLPKDGYELSAWSPEVAEVVPAEDVTYTASWIINKYTVTFVSDGKTVKSESLEYGAPITVPDTPVKEGYTFTGWTPEVAETVPAEDVTYTATWAINSYKVTFIVDGEVVKSETLEYGAPIVAPTDLTKEGYVLSAWSPEVAETVPANDVTYTATWVVSVGIETVSLSDAKDGEYYTLQGVKIARPTKAGIYVHNGRKVALK